MNVPLYMHSVHGSPYGYSVLVDILSVASLVTDAQLELDSETRAVYII